MTQKNQTRFSVSLLSFLLAFCLICLPLEAQTDQKEKVESDFVPLFNGKNLEGWQRVNTAESTWSVKDGMLICTGKPIGELRTKKMYQNFIMEVEWRHMKPRGNAGIFVWADDITAKGVPFHRSIEVQVLENAYGNSRGHTTHGDIFPIHGAKMTPINGRGGSRAFPTESRSKPSPQWNHYRIECNQGSISLAVNHKVVTRGTKCNPSKGYICIESEGGIVHYRNMKIKVLPDTTIDESHIAIADRGYRTLYNGLDFDNLRVDGDWKSADWRFRLSGKGQLSTKEKYSSGSVLIDVVTSKKLPSIQFAGQEVNLEDYRKSFGKSGWNRVEFSVSKKGSVLKINRRRQELLKDSSKLVAGPIVLKGDGPTEFANFYVRKND